MKRVARTFGSPSCALQQPPRLTLPRIESSLAEHRQQQPRPRDRRQTYQDIGKASTLESTSSPQRSGRQKDVIDLGHSRLFQLAHSCDEQINGLLPASTASEPLKEVPCA
jgi:hypothetical protein